MNLLLPGQDVLNTLYGEFILPLPVELYNYDARNYLTYEVLSSGKWNLDWVIKHTVIVHFCVRDKPWLENSRDKFVSLCKHYALQAERLHAYLD